jgi:hypothetical protein
MRTFAPGDAESASDAALSASRTVKSGTTRVIVPSSTVVGAVASRSRDKRAYECRFERCQVGVPTCLPAVTDRRAPLHAVSWASHRSACRRNAPARASNTLVAHHISRANQRDMIACSQSIDARARRSNVLPPRDSAAGRPRRTRVSNPASRVIQRSCPALDGRSDDRCRSQCVSA